MYALGGEPRSMAKAKITHGLPEVAKLSRLSGGCAVSLMIADREPRVV